MKGLLNTEINKVKEINRGYLDAIKDTSQVKTAERETAVLKAPFHWRLVAALSSSLPGGLRSGLRPIWLGVISAWRFVLFLIRLPITLFLLLTVSVLFEIGLSLYLWRKGDETDEFNRDALDHTPKFVEQYPFLLYPIVCKSFELAFLKERIAGLHEAKARFLEVAIGEGTFSARIFPSDAGVIGLDLSPYSLRKATQMSHVEKAIICDCLQPPIAGGHFDVILANNFLHHVTQKHETLSRWSRVAKKLIFNENSPYWASGWVTAYVKRVMGFKGSAAKSAAKFERKFLQTLETKERLDQIIEQELEITESVSYMSERTYFFCAIYSFILGSPASTPLYQKFKKVFLSAPLRWAVIPLTNRIARLLIRFDQYQDRSKDVFLSYVCESRNIAASISAGSYLLCPRCGQPLTASNQCPDCRKQYVEIDQMLFLLPDELAHIQEEYNPEVALSIPKEHL